MLFLPIWVFGFKTSDRVFYIKNSLPSVLKHPAGCLHFKQPDEHFTNAFEIILCHIWWSFYFYISGNAWGFWGTCYVERIRISTEGKSRVYPSELFLLWRLWIVARKSYFRKSLGGVILERSKVPPGYAVGKQGLVFWWNEETSERTCSPIFFSS